MARLRAPRHFRKLVSGKPLADELLANGNWAIVTNEVFALLSGEGEVLLARPWHEIATGEWDGDRHVLTITWVDGTQPLRVKTRDPAPASFTRVFKERVDASVVYAETTPVPGGVLRGSLRRTPSGELISQISSDTKLTQTPELAVAVERLEARLWEFIGI